MAKRQQQQPQPRETRSARMAQRQPRLLGTGEARRLVQDGTITLADGYERRDYRPGKPVYTSMTRPEALRLVSTHHDAVGGRSALDAGAELKCGPVVVRRCRVDTRTADGKAGKAPRGDEGGAPGDPEAPTS